jgi:gluconate 2-dehydrogenase gamma chain
MLKRTLTRRLVLAASAATSALAGLRGDAKALVLPPPADADRPDLADPRQGYLFFSATEAAFIESAVARLIPNDELGPGAVETGVPIFIDRQLAGPYGQGDHFYLKGPFPSSEKTQGWQMRDPASVYRAAIAEINRYTIDAKGKDFASLAGHDQDQILGALESGDAKLKGAIDGKAFFDLLLQNTIEGFFADPLYGGNRAMAGWKLIGFPGARYNHRDFVTRHGEPYPLPPVAIGGRADWTRSKS